MASPPATPLLLIRHARTPTSGGLAGRLDIAAELPSEADLARARQWLAAFRHPRPRLITSPLQRCRQTASALFPDLHPAEDARLREQDFGAWEGLAPAALPDLGPLSRTALAAHRPPGGESFQDLASRAAPALTGIAAHGPAIIVTHAGPIRAALGLALEDIAQGLAFEIAPFSATLLNALPGGGWAIGFVNQPLTPS